jgi:prepilin-type N-terminal cleavage/methylation domain-containing protein
MLTLKKTQKGFTLIRRKGLNPRAGKGFTLIMPAAGIKVKRKAFTLIELLVAVSIFSGVVVLTLGAFARSADSSIRSSLIREKTEAARTVVDRIGSDMEYIFPDREFNSTSDTCASLGQRQFGYSFSDSCLFLVLKYPGASESNELVTHRYRQSGNEVYFQEESRCSISGSPAYAITCLNEATTESNLLGQKYIFDADTQFIGGILSSSAQTNNEQPRVDVTVTVKPNDQVNLNTSCVSGGNPECYTIKTSFVPSF